MKTSLSERLHGDLYFALQKLRGRPVRARMRQLQRWERLDRAAFERLCAARLAETLAHAKRRVPLYSTEVWREAFRRYDPSDVRSWPVLERETVQSRGAELLAQPVPESLHYHSTSGSTGRPLRVAFDREADTWNRASIYRTLLWHGIPVGAPRVMLAVPAASAPPLMDWVRNLKFFSVRDLSAARLGEVLDYVVRTRPTYLWGLPSAILELARYARDEAPHLPRPVVPYVRVWGEMLFPAQREEIGQALGARLIETYGCEEIGMIAHECPAGSLHVLGEQVRVEILRDGKPAAPGEVGDIALTALRNRAMPLVRYRIGDRGALASDPCSCGRPHPVLTAIEGRMGDVLCAADGTPVYGGMLASGLWKILGHAPTGAIGKVLYEQLDPLSWRVLVEAGPGFDDRLVAELVESVRGPFGARCQVEVQRVAEIPREPSGKFRYYRTVAGNSPRPPPTVPRE